MRTDIEDFDLQGEEEEFPYPHRITRDAFAQGLTGERTNDENFDVDKFLYDHYRFTLLDDALSELTELLEDLDHELLDLLNNDYNDFINLGKTLDGGEVLVDKLRISVTKYQKKLNDEIKKLNESETYVESVLDNVNQLEKLKVSAKNMIVLDKLIHDFETLLAQNMPGFQSETINIEILRHLTSLYLTINQLLSTLPPKLPFVKLNMDKLDTLHHEYLGLLDDFIMEKKNKDEVHVVLGIYTVIGEEKHAISVLRREVDNI